MTVQQELQRARIVVIAKSINHQYSAAGPGHSWVDGTFYDLSTDEIVVGTASRPLRVFSENSSGRFQMDNDIRYLLFLSECAGQLYVDARGNSGSLSNRREVLDEVRSTLRKQLPRGDH